MLSDISKAPEVVVAKEIFRFPVEKGGFFVFQKFVCNMSNQYRCVVKLCFHLNDMKHFYASDDKFRYFQIKEELLGSIGKSCSLLTEFFGFLPNGRV